MLSFKMYLSARDCVRFRSQGRRGPAIFCDIIQSSRHIDVQRIARPERPSLQAKLGARLGAAMNLGGART